MNKYSVSLFSVLLAGVAYADIPSVNLNGENIQIDSAQALLVRSAASPAKVHLEMMVPIRSTVCTQYASHQVYGQDSSCGYVTVPETVCHEEGYFNVMSFDADNKDDGVVRGGGSDPSHPPIVRGGGGGDDHHGGGDHGSGGYHGGGDGDDHHGGGGYHGGDGDDHHQTHTVCHTEYVNREASCYHSETYCAAYGVVTNPESRKITLVFRNNSAMKTGETETFMINAEEGGHHMFRDSTFSLSVKDSARKYEIKQNALYMFDPRLMIRETN